MRLDHVSVTSEKQQFGSDQAYQIRAELKDTPSSGWRMRFQSMWNSTPEYRQICSDVQVEGNQILFSVKDPAKVQASLKALSNAVSDADRSPDQPASVLAPVIRVASRRSGRSII